MCVIAFSPKGTDAPTEDKIRQMFRANPDGAGFAYNGRHGKVFYEKGFMTVESLLERLKPLEQWKNKNFAIHFRIGTAGKNDEHTCHPFELSTEYRDLRKTKGTGPVLFHNGVLADGGLADKHSSDTQDFVIAFAPMLKKFNKSKVRDAWLEEIITGSRLLIMYENNKFKMHGTWQRDGELLVSNRVYASYGTYSYGTYSQTDWTNYSAYHQNSTVSTATTATTKSTSEQADEEFDEWFAKRANKTDDEFYEANGLFNMLMAEGYLFVTQEELSLLKKYADKYSKNQIVYNGYPYQYSEKTMCVWDETEWMY